MHHGNFGMHTKCTQTILVHARAILCWLTGEWEDAGNVTINLSINFITAVVGTMITLQVC